MTLNIPLDTRTIRVAKAIHAREHPLQKWDDQTDRVMEHYLVRAFHEVLTWEDMVRKRMAVVRARIEDDLAKHGVVITYGR